MYVTSELKQNQRQTTQISTSRIMSDYTDKILGNAQFFCKLYSTHQMLVHYHYCLLPGSFFCTYLKEKTASVVPLPAIKPR